MEENVQKEQKSAFDLLTEMYNSQKALNTRMINLEEALLLILNELRNKQNIINAIPKEERKEVFTMEASEDITIEPEKDDNKLVPIKNIRVVGTIKNEQDKTLGGVSVLFFDERNNNFKKTKSNRAGQYFAFLPPGKYTVNYVSKILKIDKNINFEIKIGDKEVKL